MASRRFVGHLNSFYQPQKGDTVIGIIERHLNEDWQVDIGYSHSAILPQLAFTGVTKRTCPKFRRGDMVAAYIDDAPDAGETILSCIPRPKMNEEFGPLTGGGLLRCRQADIDTVKRLNLMEIVVARIRATPNAAIMLTVAFGKNGRAFIETGNPLVTLQLIHCITEALATDDPLGAFEEAFARIHITA
jgi:exosome complex RNA-binding protein Rrp4